MIATVLSKGSHQSFPWSDSPNRFLSKTCCRMRSNTPVTERSRSARRFQMPLALSDAGVGVSAPVFPEIELSRDSLNWKAIVMTDGDWAWVWVALSTPLQRTVGK